LFDYKGIREEIITRKGLFLSADNSKKETTSFELRAIILLVAGVRGTRQTKTSLPELQCKLRGR